MNRIFRKTLIAALAVTVVGLVNAQSLAEKPTTPAPKHEKQAPSVEKNLKVFDTLDFDDTQI